MLKEIPVSAISAAEDINDTTHVIADYTKFEYYMPFRS